MTIGQLIKQLSQYDFNLQVRVMVTKEMKFKTSIYGEQFDISAIRNYANPDGSYTEIELQIPYNIVRLPDA